ncbi:tRNA (adenosine(37)-N6)-dimethylallyltransferase MiaA [Candidatus Uhrbacteria bacterium]|jgi:tRNA dimethylallyltransferase|nr:tRNA (adenosine(37)-N6)-dimethylallyltransferase MiaA [Candidatus Uhrbacteria bacterium]
MKQKIIAIVGPTAAGKTGLGIALAKKYNGEVISVDSRQVYKGMDVGTAKAEGKWVEVEIEKGGSIDQLFGARKTFLVDDVPHWGIDLVSPDKDYSAAQFKEYAEQKIKEIAERGRVPILVGGTGMWLKALVDNLDLASTPSDKGMRAELEARRLGDLFHEYKELDPVGAETIDKNNKRRVMRALEVTKLTGKPFSELRTAGESKYDVLQLGLSLDREALYERINDRVDVMIGLGLVDEVRALKEKYGCGIDAMTGIGYRQVCEFLDGKESLRFAIIETKKASRHYAKRQMTWFRRDERVLWITSGEEVNVAVDNFLK